MMTASIERHLAQALANEPRPWPDSWNGQNAPRAVLDEILYHGVAGLLARNGSSLDGLPDEVAAAVQSQAVAQAMWELRHRALLAELLSSLAEERIVPLFLKGTAVAYDLYDPPANRARGDSDLLVARHDVGKAQRVLKALGYRAANDERGVRETDLQQSWSLTCEDGSSHCIDLHWQVMNSPAFADVLTYEECLAASVALPRLAPNARGLDRVRTLMHTCLHRAIHITSPYVVGGRTYYGGDRLIWVYDIHLLGTALTPDEWLRFRVLARQYGAAAVCLDGLRAAQQAFATPIPEEVCAELGIAPRTEKISHYMLHSRQLGRAWRDLLAVRGVRRKLAYLHSRLWPSARFVQDKYGRGPGSPVAHLYLRRIAEFVRPRPERDHK